MKKLLAVALPAGLAVLAAVLLVSTMRSRQDAAEARLERARLKRDFAERAALAKAVSPEKAAEWQADVVALSRWYFGELQAIKNRHPAERRDAEAAPAAEGADAKKQERREQLEDFRKYADGRLALLRDGAYAVRGSAAAEGLRFDVLAVEPGKSPEGAAGLRVDFALWGAPRFLERERVGDHTVTRNVIPLAFRRLAFSFLDPAGKLYGEMSGAGEPYQKLSDPERFGEDFPPGVLFGTWWVEAFPREAARVKVELAVDVRAPSGAVRPAAFALELPVPEAWKLPPGAAFQAEAREAAPAR